MALLPKYYYGSSTFAQPASLYAGSNNERLAELFKEMDYKYDTNLEGYNSLLDQINEYTLSMRDQNSPYLMQALANAKKTLADYQEGAVKSGDWEQATLAVNKAYHDFANDMNVKGGLTDYQQQQAHLTSLQEKLNSGEISEEQYRNAISHSNALNVEPVTFDEKTGTYNNIYSGYSPVKYQDFLQQAQDLFNGWQEDEMPFTIGADANGNPIQVEYRGGVIPGYFIVGTTQQITEDELRNSATQMVMNNSNNRAYLEEQLMFDKNQYAAIDEETGGYKYDDAGNIVYEGLDYNELVKQFPVGYNDDGSAIYLSDEEIADFESKGTTSEDLYNYLKTDETVRNAIEPAVQKSSYSRVKNEYLQDVVLLKQMDNANAITLEKMKQDFDKWKLNQEYLAANPLMNISINSKLQAGTDYDAPSQQNAIKVLNTEKDRLQALVDSGTATAEDKASLDETTAQVELLDNIETNRINSYLSTDEGKAIIQPMYDIYLESLEKGDNIFSNAGIGKKAVATGTGASTEPMTIEEFATNIVGTDVDLLGAKVLKNTLKNRNIISLTPKTTELLLSTEKLEDFMDGVKTFDEGLNQYAKDNTISHGYDLVATTDFVNTVLEGAYNIGGFSKDLQTGETVSELEAKYPTQYYDKKFFYDKGGSNIMQVVYRLKDDINGYINNDGNLVDKDGKVLLPNAVAQAESLVALSSDENIGEYIGENGIKDAMKSMGWTTDEVITDLGEYPDIWKGNQSKLDSYNMNVETAAQGTFDAIPEINRMKKAYKNNSIVDGQQAEITHPNTGQEFIITSYTGTDASNYMPYYTIDYIDGAEFDEDGNPNPTFNQLVRMGESLNEKGKIDNPLADVTAVEVELYKVSKPLTTSKEGLTNILGTTGIEYSTGSKTKDKVTLPTNK